MLLMGFSETGNRYDVKHPGDVAQGICGAVPKYWSKELEENNIKLNSLETCIYIYNNLLDKYDGNRRKALIYYKGIKSKEHMWIVNKILSIRKTLIEKYK